MSPMNSRDTVLNRLRMCLAHDRQREAPPAPEVWPRLNPSAAEMACRFQAELEAVHGEVLRASSMEDARRQLDGLLNKNQWNPLGALDRPLCREVTAGLAAERLAWVGEDWTPDRIAGLPVGMIEADRLLADTGSSMISCGLAHERLMCYLPPACIVVAKADRLAEHLPAAWAEIARRTADRGTRGEFVFITGPSRTADIEKILILGVHGPKRLIVLLID